MGPAVGHQMLPLHPHTSPVGRKLSTSHPMHSKTQDAPWGPADGMRPPYSKPGSGSTPA